MYDRLFCEKLDEIRSAGQYRTFVTLNRVCGQYPLAHIDGENRKVTVWCSNDYLGMSQNPIVRRAMHDAIDKYGAGSGGSRNIGGTHKLYAELESLLAKWHAKEASLVFPTGFSSNDATLQCLLRLIPDCVALSDEKNHASIINGIRASNVRRHVFRHNDVHHLKELLDQYPRNHPKIIIFESIYSMDGDVAPAVDIIRLAKQYNALTFLDEVHAVVGMYGPRGAGIAADLQLCEEIDIVQGTMAKAIGIIGGYIAASHSLIDTIRSFAPGFIFTTSLPPAIVAGCIASIDYLMKHSEERDQLHRQTRTLRQALLSKRIPVLPCSSTHVLPVMIGDASKCKRAAARLLGTHGIYLQPINYPSVAIGSERFRVNATPVHTDVHIADLAQSLSEVFEHFDIPLLDAEKANHNHELS
ncbi:5-aminolevulinate synthase [Candidatus Burkholderia verschuerenii]|uniref:5-aminolevulinate synthase n=1 Tax=Candidatus Burkholderia verschuerenii TaxID=242163 RepID=A0A0L0M9W5_9BURK|nr:5-aminolevulinate synthase [Candidatus Burkholderia verschuerenii]KND59168.1 5-aminolevulinate synthase [Candidatus Burkholderia verschuerenii]